MSAQDGDQGVSRGVDGPEDDNPGGLDVDEVTDDDGHTRYVVRDDQGIAEIADDMSGLSEAARRQAADEGLPGA